MKSLILTVAALATSATGPVLAQQAGPNSKPAPTPDRDILQARQNADETPRQPARPGRSSSLVQRGPITPEIRSFRFAPMRPAVFPDESRTIDGTDNNPLDFERGAAGITLFRTVAPAYGGDGSGDVPARASGPSPRAISNAVHAQTSPIPSPIGASDMLWQWGQFIDHDIDETPIADDPAEPFDIPVPAGDFFFDPNATGTETIPLDRSAGRDVGGVREQLNNITSYIDGSAVYGSEPERTHALRKNDGSGRLKTGPGDLLPFNTEGLPNADSTSDEFFLAGDIRANEQVGLTAMHTLWVREHNHWAGIFRFALPFADGDTVFELARAIVGAEMQAITYNEFVPLLLGEDALPPYRGYDESINASIANEFATAAYRVGHTMLSGTLRRVGPDGSTAPEGNLPLRDAFFNPGEITRHGIDSVLRGLASQHAQRIDRFVVDDVRNFLFGPPGAGGFDLASLNIQRGREHGLGSYNDVRAAYGLPRVTNFEQISTEPATVAALESVYTGVDDIDPWTGMLCEDQAPGAMVGETIRAVLADQFRRLRDGDRFFYKSYFDAFTRYLIEQQTLARVIRRNTGIGPELQDHPMRIPVPVCEADLNGDGMADVADLIMFFRAFASREPEADFTGDGTINIFDVLTYINAYVQGCN